MSTGKITVRTTMQPWRELQVSHTEYTQLKAEGLLVETPEQPAGDKDKRQARQVTRMKGE